MLVVLSFGRVGAQESLTLDLAKCREMALQASEDLQKSENSQTQSEYNRKIAVSGFLPAFDATGTGVYVTPNTEMSGMEMIMKGTYLAGITLTQPLYAGGKIIAGNRMSKLGLEASEQQLRQTKAGTIYDADNAYWTYVSVLEKQKMMESLVDQMDTLFSQVEVAANAGMSTEADLLTVKAKKSEVDYQMQKVRSGVNLCRMALCRVLGVPFDTEIVPEDNCLTAEYKTLNADASVESRPELKLLQTNVEVTRQQVRMTQGDYLPQLALVAGYINYGNIKLKSMVSDGAGGYVPYESKMQQGLGTAMLSLSIPIFRWGQGYNKVRKARLDVANAELDLQKNEKLLTLEAQQAASNLTDSYALVESARLGLEQSEENFRVISNRYEASLCPLSDWLDAQFQWRQARSNLIEAVTQSRIAETDWLRATGRLVGEPD